MLDIIGYIALGAIVVGVLCFIAAALLDEELFVGPAFLLVVTGLLVFVPIAVYSGVSNNKRLMKQCMNAGKQEFECYSMLKQDVVPVFIPIPTGR